MGIVRCSGSFFQLLRSLRRPRLLPIVPTSLPGSYRRLHISPAWWAIKSQVLKDVGEGERDLPWHQFCDRSYIHCSPGITEVQIIQWYVEEGARVEEWKPLCQYQSDKAVDDVSRLLSDSCACRCAIITRRYRLHRDTKV